MAGGRLAKMHEDLISRILVICGERVMIDAELAELYGVMTKALMQRNRSIGFTAEIEKTPARQMGNGRRGRSKKGLTPLSFTKTRLRIRC